MTLEQELKQKFVGKTAVFKVGEVLEFNVEIVDFKRAFGHNTFRIKPVSGGSESAWIRNTGKLIV